MPRPLGYHAAMRVLLEGTCGMNGLEVERHTGLSRQAVMRFCRGGESDPRADTVDAIAMFVWKRMNAHLLLCDEDRAT